jgi:hypothetical protein
VQFGFGSGAGGAGIITAHLRFTKFKGALLEFSFDGSAPFGDFLKQFLQAANLCVCAL